MSKVHDALRRVDLESVALPVSVLPVAAASATVQERPAPAATRRLPPQLPPNSPLFPFEKDAWQAGEQYRILRTKLVQHAKQPKVLLVSSAGPGDGKSTTAVNLAAVLGLKEDAPVLLVDSDFRCSQLDTRLGLPRTPGLAEVLHADCTWEQAVIQLDNLPSLHLLPVGDARRNPSELLDSSAWRELMKNLRERYSYIIIDSPPVAAVADYDLLQAAGDGVVMVARPDFTNRKLCLKAIATIPKEKMIGIVLNCVEDWFLAPSTTYYAYGANQYGPPKLAR